MQDNLYQVRSQSVIVYIGLDMSGYQVNIFSYFSRKTYVMGTQ